MASLQTLLEGPIPRPLLWIGTPIAAVVLIGIFVFLRFPYGAFAPALSAQLSQATGSDVQVRDIEARLTLAGPGMAARDVRIVPPGQSPVDIDPLLIRPAWSTSWLRGDPALKVEADSAAGHADGVMVIGGRPAWSGELVDVDLALLPAATIEGLSLSGRVTAAADLAMTEEGPEGPLSFDASTGSIDHPAMPIGIAFDRITADLVLGGETVVDVQAFELDGPIVFASVSGAITKGSRPGNDQLDLDVDVEIKNPLLRGMIQQMGVGIDGRGRGQFSLGGTTRSPKVR